MLHGLFSVSPSFVKIGLRQEFHNPLFLVTHRSSASLATGNTGCRYVRPTGFRCGILVLAPAAKIELSSELRVVVRVMAAVAHRLLRLVL